MEQNVTEKDLTESERRIAQILLDYMKKYPEATHTGEGIARWWILQQKFEEELDTVKKIITYFTEVGLLEKKIQPDGNSSFKIKLENLENISLN